jgi:hypothetical protein
MHLRGLTLGAVKLKLNLCVNVAVSVSTPSAEFWLHDWIFQQISLSPQC